MKPSRSGAAVALMATLFAGALLGVGNATHALLTAATDGRPVSQHAGHHAGSQSHLHHTSSGAAALPAHCLFCLDGMAPQPVALVLPVPEPRRQTVWSAAPVGVRAPAPVAWRIHHCREPPVAPL